MENKPTEEISSQIKELSSKWLTLKNEIKKTSLLRLAESSLIIIFFGNKFIEDIHY